MYMNLFFLKKARAPGSPVIIIGTNLDRLKTEAEKTQKKKELSELIYSKYLVGRSTREQRESGLPKIIEIAFVGCPPTGRAEGVSELRQTLYDVAFNLTVPKGMLCMCMYVCVCIPACVCMCVCIYKCKLHQRYDA